MCDQVRLRIIKVFVVILKAFHMVNSALSLILFSNIHQIVFFSAYKYRVSSDNVFYDYQSRVD